MADAVTPHEKSGLTNTACMEAVHARNYSSVLSTLRQTMDVDEGKRQQLKDFAFVLLFDLCESEKRYIDNRYDSLGLSEDVKYFLHYNANKALQNLGYEAQFPDLVCDVSPVIVASLSPNADENPDFFSDTGSSHVIGKTVTSEVEDWAYQRLCLYVDSITALSVQYAYH